MRCLAPFAVAVAIVSLPAVASAQDHTAVDLVVDGDLPGARAAVVSALGGDLPADARAANMELLVVIERWSTTGGRPKSRLDDTAVNEGADWNGSFVAARDALVEGRSAAAESRLGALERSAPDAVSRARAHALMTLAHDVGVHDAATPSAPPPPVTATIRHAPDGPSKEGRVWYGWETLICDGASLVTSTILVGIGGYALCAPIVHLANGQAAKAGASIGLRLGAPLGVGITATALVYAASDGQRCDLGCALAFVVGAGAGVVSAVVVDATVLARKDVKKTEKTSTAPTASIVPTGNAHRDRVELGLAGTF